MTTRVEAVSALGSTLPTIPMTDVTGEYSANEALKRIRGYTTEEVVTAAATYVTEAGQHKAIVKAIAARFSAKTAKRIARNNA